MKVDPERPRKNCQLSDNLDKLVCGRAQGWANLGIVIADQKADI